MKKYFLILMLLVLTSTQILFSQEHRWQLTLADGKIMSGVTLDSLSNGSLVVKRNNSSLSVEVKQIREIRLMKESKLEEGAEIGAGVGLIVGAVYYLATYKEESLSHPNWTVVPDVRPAGKVLGTLGSSIVCGLAGAIVGGVVGAVSSRDEVYDLSQLTSEAKLVSINKILTQQQAKR